MKKIIIALALIVPLAACSTTERNTTIGAAGGAIIGGAISGDVGGAAAGAVVGGAAGYLLSKSDRSGYCIYRDRHGRRYEARCR